MKWAYYNEIDEAAAHVLRAQIKAGVIAPGEVDTRSIRDVHATDVRGFVQCHFFAGGGLWSVAARLAGWPDDRPLWTGSCPCQPFSKAARGRGIRFKSERDLWPSWARLIAECRPAKIAGEQIVDGEWADRLCDDLEAVGYTVWAGVLPACSVQADHERARLYFACNADRNGESELRVDAKVARVPWRYSFAGAMAHADDVPGRVELLRIGGNAIVPQVAAEVLGALMDAD